MTKSDNMMKFPIQVFFVAHGAPEFINKRDPSSYLTFKIKWVAVRKNSTKTSTRLFLWTRFIASIISKSKIENSSQKQTFLSSTISRSGGQYEMSDPPCAMRVGSVTRVGSKTLRVHSVDEWVIGRILNRLSWKPPCRSYSVGVGFLRLNTLKHTGKNYHWDETYKKKNMTHTRYHHRHTCWHKFQNRRSCWIL